MVAIEAAIVAKYGSSNNRSALAAGVAVLFMYITTSANAFLLKNNLTLRTDSRIGLPDSVILLYTSIARKYFPPTFVQRVWLGVFRCSCCPQFRFRSLPQLDLQLSVGSII